MQRAGVLLLALCACVKTESITCELGTENERTCPAHEACDDTHHLCVPDDAMSACADKDNDADCTAGGAPGFCREHVCIGVHCGDGIAVGGELCDGDDLRGKTCQDFPRFYDPAPLHCTDSCGLDFSACTGTCGDGVLDSAHELCDGAPPQLACTDFGFGAGYLACSSNCGPQFDDCKFFGWHTPYLAPNTVFDFAASSDSNVFEVGLGVTMQHYDGRFWADVDLSACMASSPTLAAVDTIANNDAWVGAKLASGVALAHVTPTACTSYPTTTLTDITDIDVVSPTDIWVTTGVTNASTYHFDGQTFTLRDPGVQTNVWAASSTDVYTWSSTIGASTLRHLTGGAFSAVTLPTTAPALRTIDVVWGTSSADVYVGGSDTSLNTLLFHNDGTGWQLVSTTNATGPIPGRVTSVGKANGRLFMGVAVGATSPANPHVWALDGTVWVDLGMPAPGGDPRMLISSTGQMVVSLSGSKAIERYDGAVVIDRTPSPGFKALHAIEKRADTAYAVSTVGDFYVWDGATFTKDTSQTGVSFKDVTVGPAGAVYMATDAGIKKRANNVISAVDSTANAISTRIWSNGATDMWVVTGNGFKLGHYTGAATAVCATCGPYTDAVYSIWGSATNDVWAVGDNGTIRHWDGSQWTLQPQLITREWQEVTGWAANDVIAMAKFSGVYAFDGTSWKTLGFPIPGFHLTTIWGTSGKDFFVGSPNGYLFHYDGAHWTPVAIPTLSGAVASMGDGDTIFFFDETQVVHELVRTKTW